MKFSFATALVVTLAAEATVASSWFSKAAYNKWHETELERWLSDHDVPYPTPADRKDLENLVKTNWQAAVESPYVNWDADRLQKYLNKRGKEAKKGTEKNKDQLVNQVKATWHETSSQADEAYKNVHNWIFDSWTESQLKAFADKHKIPVPQPRKRDSLLKSVRENYSDAAKKAGEYASYPGSWLYAAWSDSDLKSWLDERSIPAPQPSNRDKLVAAVRRNAREASVESQAALSSLSASADAAKATLADEIFEKWSDSDIKAWADKNGIKVPQGSSRNELLALARKNYAKVAGDNVASEASSAFHAGTTSAGNEFAKATDEASRKGQNIFDQLKDQAFGLVDQVQIALGLKDNYASSASKSATQATKSASSAFNKATKSARNEL